MKEKRGAVMAMKQIVTIFICALLLAFFTAACGSDVGGDGLTRVAIKISKSVDGVSPELIEGGQTRAAVALNRKIAVRVVVTAPDLSPPFVKNFSFANAAGGVIEMFVPSGKARTFYVLVLEEVTQGGNNVFPGTAFIPSNTAAARTFDLTGNPVYIPVPMQPASTYDLTGAVNDDRLGALAPLGQGCGPGPFPARAVFVDVASGFPLMGINVDVNPNYTIFGVPHKIDLQLLMRDNYSNAAGSIPLPRDPAEPRTVNSNIDLFGYQSLAISPVAVNLAQGQTRTFVASGGQGGYNFTATNPLAVIDFITGDYTAPGTPFVSDTITLTDACPPNSVSAAVTEIITQCSDGLDNDGDGQIDFPNDPGCSSPADNDELGTNECDDGIDNDGDTFIDFPADPQCLNPSELNEAFAG